jgi:hypothetical protein
MRATTYEVRIDGALTRHALEELAGMRLVGQGPRESRLRGVIPDQAALLGLVVHVEEVGCVVRDLVASYGPGAAPRRGPLNGPGWQIRVRGVLSQAVAASLDGMRVVEVGGDTRTTAIVVGHAGSRRSLSAAITALQAFGLEVVDVHEVRG